MSLERKLIRVFPNPASANTWETSSDYTEPYIGYIHSGTSAYTHFSLSLTPERNLLTLNYSSTPAKAAWYSAPLNGAQVKSGNAWENYDDFVPTSKTIGVKLVNELPDGAFLNKTTLTTVTHIPYGIKSIPPSCFNGCSNLGTFASIPSTVTSIGNLAFAGTKFTAFTIPNTVSTVGIGAFSGCTSLKSAVLPSGLTTINVELFHGCSQLTSITIPENVTAIGDAAFNGCAALASATIPSKVTTIGHDAFANTKIKTAELSSGLTSLGTGAFANNTSLTSLTITSGCKITSVPESCFRNTRLVNADLTGLTAATSIGVSAFTDVTTLTSVTLPAKVSAIKTAAFQDCTGLKNIAWSTGLTALDDNVFENAGFEEITLPNTVHTIATELFKNCASLKKVVFPTHTGFTNIPEGTCYGCAALETVEIPANVTDIGENAFSGCSAIAGMKVEATTPPTLGTNAIDARLAEAENFTISVPEGSVDTYKGADGWSAFASKIVGH